MHLLCSVFLALASLYVSTSSAWAQEGPGIQQLLLPAAHRGRPLQVVLWYPAQAGGRADKVGANRLFYGSPARWDAPAAPGRHPLLLLSHGSGGNAIGLGWLATQLAQQGFIVAAPNHPGSTTGDSTPSTTVQIWQRPADLSAVTSALLAHPDWQARIAPRRIAVLGFSLGGYTALALAGAQVRLADYIHYCATPVPPGTVINECPWFARGGVDLQRVDAGRFEQSHLDPRIRAVVAVDPGLAQAFDAASLRSMGVPVQFINLGRPGQLPLAVDATRLAPVVPASRYAFVSDATHFSFLGVCKPNGAALLADEGEFDPVCEDGGGRPRAEIHAELVQTILAGLAVLMPPQEPQKP
nr:hypothetical protein [uncultured Albidiferax sp.]